MAKVSITVEFNDEADGTTSINARSNIPEDGLKNPTDAQEAALDLWGYLQTLVAGENTAEEETEEDETEEDEPSDEPPKPN